MAGFANFVSNAGLVGECMDQGKQAENALELQRQQVETGKMGLEDVTRNRATELAARQAAGAASSGGLQNSLEAQAKVYESAGRPELAIKARQSQQALIDAGAHDVIHSVMLNDAPGARPDIAEISNRYGKVKLDPAKTMLVDLPDKSDKVIRSVDLQGNQINIPVGKTAMLLGMIKPPTVHTIPQGGSLGVVSPMGGVTTTQGQPKQFSASQDVIHVERSDADGNKRTYAYDKPAKKWIGGAPPGEEGAPPEAEGGAGVRKNLPVLKAVDEAIS